MHVLSQHLDFFYFLVCFFSSSDKRKTEDLINAIILRKRANNKRNENFPIILKMSLRLLPQQLLLFAISPPSSAQLVNVGGIYSNLLHFSIVRQTGEIVVANKLHSICSQLLEVRRLENCDRFSGHSQIAHECWWQLRSNDDESPLNLFRNVCRAPRQLIFALINSESRRRMIIMILL